MLSLLDRPSDSQADLIAHGEGVIGRANQVFTAHAQRLQVAVDYTAKDRFLKPAFERGFVDALYQDLQGVRAYGEHLAKQSRSLEMMVYLEVTRVKSELDFSKESDKNNQKGRDYRLYHLRWRTRGLVKHVSINQLPTHLAGLSGVQRRSAIDLAAKASTVNTFTQMLRGWISAVHKQNLNLEEIRQLEKLA